ncbi:hypothetical protein B4168_1123 [Anoxybacillus flavithermus]|nr:hypothetical protein B4168_1123 [Anoxybacillus flavithermus]OAO88234.1 hypothetical protein GT23_0510 [Parageobacillus thermoglucosidasius]
MAPPAYESFSVQHASVTCLPCAAFPRAGNDASVTCRPFAAPMPTYN